MFQTEDGDWRSSPPDLGMGKIQQHQDNVGRCIEPTPVGVQLLTIDRE